MILPNNWASELLGKDKIKAAKAAEHIINTSDTEAWKCLIDNSDYLFSYIKEKAGKYLANAVSKDNIEKVFPLLNYHSPDWDGCLAFALSKYSDENLNKQFLEFLNTGTCQEKSYAAKYFCFVADKISAGSLFECAKSDYQPLKVNSAEALGKLNDQDSYNYFISKLNSQDDWEKIEAAQFLSAYGNKDAVVQMLRAMSESGMAEHMAGEIAGFANIFEYFENPDIEIQQLALEAFDNILSGIAEIWSLSVLFDFKVYESVEKLIELANKNPDNELSGRYAQLLLKAKMKAILFTENSEYTFDEEKAILNELEEIYHLLIVESDEFWDSQSVNINKELICGNVKRKIAAINVISELGLSKSLPCMIDALSDCTQHEVVICEIIMTLEKMQCLDSIIDIDRLVSSVKDKNILAIIKNALNKAKLI